MAGGTPAPVEIPADLPAPLVPLAWLLGTWEGAGVSGFPGQEEARFGQEVVFSHDGRPVLSYVSRTWLLDEDGTPGEPLTTETGYWRPLDGLGLEVLLAHPDGVVEAYLGEVDGAKVEMRTDVVVATESPKDHPGYSAGHRLYGRVEGDLMWVYELAAQDQPLAPVMSARLKRV
ncbi:FABP family protein [Vallicoccus soli]|uniref:Ferric nitrobindin-like protein n=1 Tax=Vallicoccus soli TaxID=2339232 RepID=A0A3A3Z437_9ACTN|nr:FABP family protein [Vallicoccus soli]RJK97723.1 FABP family protein [Vallicoccus soli]